MAFKFLHLADVHLDTPFQSKDRQLRLFLRESIRKAFQKAVDLALSQRVNAVLIAGDLFDNDTLSFATERFILEQMERLKDARVMVFYAPGNHDPAGVAYRRSTIQWPDNVKVFNSLKPEVCPVRDEQGRPLAYVVGAGHESQHERGNLVKNFPPPDHANIPYIGLAHVWVMGSQGEAEHDRYAPCTLEDLLAKGYTYWALGHIHTRAHLWEQPPVVYPGNLVGRNFREDGLKGAYLVEIYGAGEARTIFHPLAPVCWTSFRVDNLSAAKSLADLQKHIRETVIARLEDGQPTGDIIARMLLEGPSPLYKELENEDNIRELEEYLLVSLEFRHAEVIAEGVARPVIPNDYRGQPHILGVALDMLEKAKTQPDLLMRLKPERLAGCAADAPEEILSYLSDLLDGMEYDVAARLLEEEGI
ncbi:MAG: DNA repair exonuclease [Clostridiales bacterium]|jgi:DNA repair exonuclease SbcCD nuclease subunit|nr:DNA repair exonuclease [Clostridiales bacterium]